MENEAASETVQNLIARLELRLEQYKIHADSLEQGSKDRAGADEVVSRLERRIENLREFGMGLVSPRDLAAHMRAAQRPDQYAKARGT
jgi:hypothetical protein